MEHVTNALSRLSSVLTKYIGMIIICFSVIAFFWRDGFAWTTNYTSIFLGVAMFGMGLTIHIGDFKVVFTRPKEIIIGFVAQYTIMPLIAWGLSVFLHLPTDIALGVILVGCCPGGTASNVITYIAGGDVALSVGMTITSTLAAPVMTPLLVYLLAGAWVQVSFPGMVISVVKVVLIPVLLGILLRRLIGRHIEKLSGILPLISVVSIVIIISGIVAVNADSSYSVSLSYIILQVWDLDYLPDASSMWNMTKQLPLRLKSVCRTAVLLSHSPPQTLLQTHLPHCLEQSSVYGTIFQALYSQVSGAAEGIR